MKNKTDMTEKNTGDSPISDKKNQNKNQNKNHNKNPKKKPIKKSSKKNKYSLRSKYPRHNKSNEKKYKKNKTSDSDNNDSTTSDESEEEFDQTEYTKFLSKMFPSRFINQRVSEILEEENQEDSCDDSSEDESYEMLQKKKRNHKKKKHVIESDSETIGEEDTSDEDDSEDDSEDDDGSDTDELYGTVYSKKKAFNILVSLDDPSYYALDEQDSDESESDESESEPSENEEDTKKKSKMKNYTEDDQKLLEKFKKIALGLKKTHGDSELLNELITIGNDKQKEIERNNKKATKKKTAKNTKEFTKLIKDKRKETDFSLFKKFDLKRQETIIEKLEEIKKYNDDAKPIRIGLLETDIPVNYKAVALRKMNTLDYMEPGTNEFYKMKQWVDTFMRIPFNKYANLPITAEDGVEKCHKFMADAQKTLNEAVYGMNDAKMQIIQMVGQWITNPSAIGTAIAIKGPMGTGKTTLVKDGISKILGREFAFIALGGATDSSILEGHSYTYEGSTWGKIVDILVQCKTMNPVIYFDELDKISNTPRGEEIASILTHLTDTTQNDKFHDKYFAEIDLDLSKCMFIFSYNEEEKVNPILRDRMYRIGTKGYSVKEKKIIVEDYLLPKIREQMKFEKGDIEISEEVLKYIIDRYTNEEKGVRNLKRCIETIYRKLNLFRLMRPGENLFEDDLAIKVEFPINITNDVVDKVIKTNEDDNKTPVSMYM